MPDSAHWQPFGTPRRLPIMFSIALSVAQNTLAEFWKSHPYLPLVLIAVSGISAYGSFSKGMWSIVSDLQWVGKLAKHKRTLKIIGILNLTYFYTTAPILLIWFGKASHVKTGGSQWFYWALLGFMIFGCWACVNGMTMRWRHMETERMRAKLKEAIDNVDKRIEDNKAIVANAGEAFRELMDFLNSRQDEYAPRLTKAEERHKTDEVTNKLLARLSLATVEIPNVHLLQSIVHLRLAQNIEIVNHYSVRRLILIMVASAYLLVAIWVGLKYAVLG